MHILHYALRELHKGNITNRRKGICNNVGAIVLDIASPTLCGCCQMHTESLFEKWVDFSGYRLYPIRDPDCTSDQWLFISSNAKIRYNATIDYWEPDNVYNQQRLELLDFMYTYVEEAFK